MYIKETYVCGLVINELCVVDKERCISGLVIDELCVGEADQFKREVGPLVLTMQLGGRDKLQMLQL